MSALDIFLGNGYKVVLELLFEPIPKFLINETKNPSPKKGISISLLGFPVPTSLPVLLWGLRTCSPRWNQTRWNQTPFVTVTGDLSEKLVLQTHPGKAGDT